MAAPLSTGTERGFVCLFFHLLILAASGLVVALHLCWFGVWTLWLWPHDIWGLCSPTKDWTGVFCIERQIFNHCTSREVPGRESLNLVANRAGAVRGAKMGEVGNQLRLHRLVIFCLTACLEGMNRNITGGKSWSWYLSSTYYMPNYYFRLLTYVLIWSSQ